MISCKGWDVRAQNTVSPAVELDLQSLVLRGVLEAALTDKTNNALKFPQVSVSVPGLQENQRP